MSSPNIDVPRSSAVLDLSVLTRQETATLVDVLRRAQYRASDVNAPLSMCQELFLLRLEARAAYLDRLFDRV
jgi:hypothetical protein